MGGPKPTLLHIATEDSKVKGTPVTVIAGRGGSYAPGTPREGYEYVQNYVRAIIADPLGADLGFIVPEPTMAPHNPAMAEPVPLCEASGERALEDAAVKAKELADAWPRDGRPAPTAGVIVLTG